MKPTETKPQLPSGRLPGRVFQVLTLGAVLVVTVASPLALGNWDLFADGSPALAPGDDPLVSGLKIFEPHLGNTTPAPVVVPASPSQAGSSEVLLQNWDYTAPSGTPRK